MYQSRDEASAIIDSMRSTYARALKQRAEWLAQYLSDVPDESVRKLILRSNPALNRNFKLKEALHRQRGVSKGDLSRPSLE
jgi:hypothetical protein